LRTTEKGLAQCGLNWTKSSIQTERSQCFFRGTKLIKKCETKKQWRLNISNLSIIDLAPHCAKPMLPAVSFIICF